MRSHEVLLNVGLFWGVRARLDKCPGEDRSSDGTCTIDGGFVCLQLLDEHGHPRDFAPAKDWWNITGQSAHKWDARIRSNGGDSWCVCATCASEIVDKVGCHAMPIRCNATNKQDIFGINLPEYGSLERCLRLKCGFSSLWDANLDDLQRDLQGGSWVQSTVVLGCAFAAATALALLLRRLLAVSNSPRYEAVDTSDGEGLLDEERFLCGPCAE